MTLVLVLIVTGIRTTMRFLFSSQWLSFRSMASRSRLLDPILRITKCMINVKYLCILHVCESARKSTRYSRTFRKLNGDTFREHWMIALG